MAVDSSAVARVTGISTQYEDRRDGAALFLPMQIAVIAQGNSDKSYSLEKYQVTRAIDAARRYGFGSPIHLICEQLLPANGDGVGTVPVWVYPLEEVYEAVAATGDVEVTANNLTASRSFRVRIGGKLSAAIVATADDTPGQIHTKIGAAIAGVLDLPATGSVTTSVELTAKWAGASGNGMRVEIIGGDLDGLEITTTDFSGGLVNPEVGDALALFGSRWITMVLNGLNISDTDALDAYQAFGGTENPDGTLTGRWDPLVKKPCLVFTGNTEADVATATTVSSARRTDLINCQIPGPNSPNLPFVVAARAVARIARLANNNPPHDYGSQRLTGLIPGPEEDDWDYTQRQQAVLAGSSTVENKDGVLNISDVVTFYRPEGEPVPAYRFVVDIIKVMNVLYNVSLEFESTEWDGAPLVPDDEVVVNATAKKPKVAKAAAAGIIDGLADQAILVNRKEAKENVQATIDSQNPKRLNLEIPVQVSGNTNIKDIRVRWGFLFGSPSAA